MPSELARAQAGPARRPPRALALVRDPAPEELGSEIDWSAWRLEWDDDVGQSFEHQSIVDGFASALRSRMAELRREGLHVGVDQFFAWVPHEPKVRVSPDVYTLPGGLPEPLPAMVETWRAGHRPPDFALEVVSDEWKKDYDDGPAKYALLGATELIVFDPDAARGDVRSPRVALQVYRRTDDGAFVRVYAGAGPARVETIDSWVFAVEGPHAQRLLRIARDPSAADVVATEGEEASVQRARADDEKRRADDEKRRADDLAAELVKLRAERERPSGG